MSTNEIRIKGWEEQIYRVVRLDPEDPEAVRKRDQSPLVNPIRPRGYTSHGPDGNMAGRTFSKESPSWGDVGKPKQRG